MSVPEGTCARCGNQWSLTHVCVPSATGANVDAPAIGASPVASAINDLRRRVDALERVQRDGDADSITLEYLGRARDAERKLETAERERDEMGAAWLALKAQCDRLAVYLRTAQEPHRPGCHIHDDPYICTCGLAAALASATPAGES